MIQRAHYSLLAVALLLTCIQGAPAQVSTNAVTLAPTNGPDRAVVYYFHRTGRCHTCLAMEEWTRQVMTSLNSAENHRALVLDVVNLDLSENEHYVQDFEITFNTVVLAEFQEGKPVRWKNLANVWDFSQDETTFKKYLEGEMGAFMEDRR